MNLVQRRASAVVVGACAATVLVVGVLAPAGWIAGDASGGGLGLLAREAALAGKLPGVVARAGGDPESVRGEDVTAAALAGWCTRRSGSSASRGPSCSTP